MANTWIGGKKSKSASAEGRDRGKVAEGRDRGKVEETGIVEFEQENRFPGALMSSMEFAHLGGGEVAYVKELSSVQAKELFPGLEDLPMNINVYSVHAADGTPIAVADSWSEAIANVLENDLEPVSVH